MWQVWGLKGSKMIKGWNERIGPGAGHLMAKAHIKCQRLSLKIEQSLSLSSLTNTPLFSSIAIPPTEVLKKKNGGPAHRRPDLWVQGGLQLVRQGWRWSDSLSLSSIKLMPFRFAQIHFSLSMDLYGSLFLCLKHYVVSVSTFLLILFYVTRFDCA